MPLQRSDFKRFFNRILLTGNVVPMMIINSAYSCLCNHSHVRKNFSQWCSLVPTNEDRKRITGNGGDWKLKSALSSSLCEGYCAYSQTNISKLKNSLQCMATQPKWFAAIHTSKDHMFSFIIVLTDDNLIHQQTNSLCSIFGRKILIGILFTIIRLL